MTIVLPIHNAFDPLPEVLHRVLRHTDLPWHLILVEDASTDPALRVTFQNLDALQPNVGDADAAKLKQALVGLQGLENTRELTTAFQDRIPPLPVVGSSVTRVLDASSATALPPAPAPGSPIGLRGQHHGGRGAGCRSPVRRSKRAAFRKQSVLGGVDRTGARWHE